MSAFFRDLLTAAAVVGVSMLTAGAGGIVLAANASLGAFAARTALILGVQTYSRRQARKAARNAAAAAVENTVTIRSIDYPECIVFGRTRVPTIFDYACHHGGNRMTLVYLLPSRHEYDAIERILFDDEDIGELDGQGFVQSGSRWFTDRLHPVTTVATGAAPGLSFFLDHTVGEMGTPGLVDSVALRRIDYLDESEGWGPAGRTVETARTLEPGEFSVSANQVTINSDSAGSDVIVTYRIRAGTAHVRVIRNLAGSVPHNFGTLAADSNGGWIASDQLTGIPNLVITLTWDEAGSLWAAGVPQITAIVRGARVYNPTLDSLNGGSGAQRRDNPATWVWSNNAALCWRHYMRHPLGMRCDDDEIDDAAVRAAVPICNALVTLRAGGSEPAFTCDGMVSTGTRVEDNVETLAMTMIGNATCTGGLWRIVPFSWTPPALTLTADSFAPAEVSVDSRPGVAAIVNSVRGKFVDTRPTEKSPAGLYTLHDFPPYESAAFIAQDEGDTYYDDIELPLTIGPERAQRMARFYMIRARNGLTLSGTFNFDAFDVLPGERVRLPLVLNGWEGMQDGGVGKVFQVMEWADEGAHRVSLLLKEDAAAYYSWDFNEATLLDATPNSNLPSPTWVAPVTGVRLDSGATTFFAQADGSIVVYVALTFDLPVAADNRVIVAWKRSSETEYREVSVPRGDAVLWLRDVARGETLNVYVYARNDLGAVSAITWVPAYVVSSDLPVPGPSQSVQLLRNPTFDLELAHWSSYEFALIVVEGITLRKADPGYVVPGSPSSALVHVRSGRTGDRLSGGTRSSRMRIRPSQAYVGYASLIGWGTSALVSISFLNEAGTYVGGANGNIIAGVPVESPLRRLDNPAHYELSVVRAVAPATAAYAELVVIGNGGWMAGPDKYVSVHRPYFGEDTPGAVTIPTWGPGPRGMVDTVDIARNAMSRVYQDRILVARQIPPGQSPGFRYTVESPHVLMPRHTAEFRGGERVTVHASLNLQVLIGGPSLTRSEITFLMGVQVEHYNQAGTAVLGGEGVFAAGVLMTHVFAAPIETSTMTGRTLYGTCSFDVDLTYRADRRILASIVIQEVVGGTPPSGWTYTALPGSHMTIEVHKTSRSA